MAKRKSKTTEFKPPKRTQPRAKRQRSSEETNPQSADETQIQTPNSENNNSHNALCSEKLDEHQPELSTLQISQTTEFPVDPCSLEEKTCNDEDGNGTNPPGTEQEIAVQTPEPNNSDKYTVSQPLNVEVTKVDQPDVELDDEKGEITSNSNHESQKVPDDCDSELPSDECQTEKEFPHEDTDSLATEPNKGEQLECSDIIDETGIQMAEDADPLVKRKIRKRMGMCRLGDRKKMLKEQPTSGNVFGEGLENKAGQDIKEDSVMMVSDDLKKDGSISLEEFSGCSFPTSCPLEDIPELEIQEEPELQALVECMSSEQEITHETHHTLPSRANSGDPLEDIETERVECSNNKSNIREDNKPEMCDDIITEIGTEVTDEVCQESTDVSTQDAIVMEGPLEVLKETNEESASTAEVADHFEELVVRGNEMEVEECCPSELDMNTFISGQTNEECVELTDIAINETVSALPVIDEIKDKSESLDCTLVAASETAETTENCEETCMWSLSSPTAPPCGEDKYVQSVSERDGLPSETHKPHPSPAEPYPSSPLSIHSVTDSQLNNIPLSLEDFPMVEDTCDLEDATDRVCGLIRDLASLNQIVRDAHRKIGFLQQAKKPARPPFRSMYGPQH
ncbi:uncharacterized protein si:ch211-286b5.2 [Pimephales promelas]|uniref:uncharacterized protein si:ch211-286b5.2 n=1 Tax=Pimephales promelas TaxID=90988 RepID=UPI001955C6A9|nr:uncharacterized protein si:ch211-286b5.2 [Pimephales promelas]